MPPEGDEQAASTPTPRNEAPDHVSLTPAECSGVFQRVAECSQEVNLCVSSIMAALAAEKPAAIPAFMAAYGKLGLEGVSELEEIPEAFRDRLRSALQQQREHLEQAERVVVTMPLKTLRNAVLAFTMALSKIGQKHFLRTEKGSGRFPRPTQEFQAIIDAFEAVIGPRNPQLSEGVKVKMISESMSYQTFDPESEHPQWSDEVPLVPAFSDAIAQIELGSNMPTLFHLYAKVNVWTCLQAAQDPSVPKEMRTVLTVFLEAYRIALDEAIDNRRGTGGPSAHEMMRSIFQDATRSVERRANFLPTLGMSTAASGDGANAGRVIETPELRANYQNCISWRMELPKGSGETARLSEGGSPEERLFTRAFRTTLPTGVLAADLFDDAYCLQGLRQSVRGAEMLSIPRILSTARLTPLLDLHREQTQQTPALRALRHLDLIRGRIQIESIPQPVDRGMVFNDQTADATGIPAERLQQLGALLTHQILCFKTYQRNPGEKAQLITPSPEAPSNGPELTEDDLWYLYFAIRNACREAENIEDILGTLFPGINTQYLMAREKAGERHEELYLKKRFIHLSELFSSSFTGHSGYVTLVRAFFISLVQDSAGAANRSRIVNSLIKGSQQLPVPADENERIARIARNWEHLATFTGSDLHQDSIQEVSAWMTPWRRSQLITRAKILEHLACFYPPIHYEPGRLFVDQAGVLPLTPDGKLLIPLVRETQRERISEDGAKQELVKDQVLMMAAF